MINKLNVSKIRLFGIALFIITFVFGSCDNGTGGGGGKSGGSGGSLTISVGNVSGRAALPDGVTPADLTHTIAITDSSGDIQNRKVGSPGGKVTFTSIALGLCTIDVKGYLDKDLKQLIAVCTEKVNIKAGSNTANIVMNVIEDDGAVTGVTLDKTATGILLGGTQTLVATVHPANATNKAVTWASSDTSIATVNSNGQVTAVKVGTAVITVTTVDGGFKASCTVTVSATAIAVTGVTLNKASISLAIGGTEKLIATVLPSNATNPDVKWESDTPSVATVDSTGLVTAINSGSSSITATAGGITARCTVTVLPELQGTVSITGHPVVGQTLTADISELEGSGTITYQWKQGSTVIGTNSSTYTIQPNDAGFTITVTVTCTGNSGGITSDGITILTQTQINQAAKDYAEDLNAVLDLSVVTVSQDDGRVIVKCTDPDEATQLPQVTLNIPEGVKVEWGIGGNHSISGEPTLTLEGDGTLVLTSEHPLMHSQGGDVIFIKSGSPTLVIPGEVDVYASGGAAIKTAQGSSPNIFLSDASEVVAGSAENSGVIVLLGGGNIIVTGNTEISNTWPSRSRIYRGPDATVKGYYDTNTNRAYFDGGSWIESGTNQNLFQGTP